MGFGEVFDYESGKLDWLAAGLPVEGSLADAPTAGTVARRDAPTCAIHERLGDVAERVRAAGWDACVVTNEERVVFGLLRAGNLEGEPDRAISEAMRPGPSTFRPHVGIEEMAEFMMEHDLSNAPITTSDGRLVGLLLREDALKAAMEGHRARHGHQGDDDPDEEGGPS